MECPPQEERGSLTSHGWRGPCSHWRVGGSPAACSNSSSQQNAVKGTKDPAGSSRASPLGAQAAGFNAGKSLRKAPGPYCGREVHGAGQGKG